MIEQKFFVAHEFSDTAKDYIVVGVYSKKEDAVERHNPALVIERPMPEILQLLSDQRLGVLAEQVKAVIERGRS